MDGCLPASCTIIRPRGSSISCYGSGVSFLGSEELCWSGTLAKDSVQLAAVALVTGDSLIGHCE